MMERNESEGFGVFDCHYTDNEGKALSWEGAWLVESMHQHSVEMTVTARGYSYRLIVGEYINGHYVCIPEWDTGSALATLQDRFWNYERLSRSMDELDALTVAAGLQDFAKVTGWGV